MSIRRTLYRRILLPALRVAASPFFARKYLVGKYFESSFQGWRWVWRAIWMQRFLGYNRHVPWPVSPWIAIDDPAGIEFDMDDLQNFQHFGCYYSNVGQGRISIGRGTFIAPNVGIVTTNHDLEDPKKHSPARNISIGKNCWIGMNSMLLPGVELGDGTVVAAGSIVTKSWTEGHCVLAGNPARLLRTLACETAELNSEAKQ